MELLLNNGDYTERDSRLVSVDGEREVLERAMFRLKVRRGSFPFMPELGSRLHLISREKPSERLSAARKYIAEAISDEEVEISEIELSESGGELTVEVGLEYSGARVTAALVV